MYDFITKVVGVTFMNPDGTDRQKILSKCKIGEPLRLIREPDNPYDEDAIAVFRQSGEQIGYLPSRVVGEGDLAVHMEKGGEVTARISRIDAGPSGFLGLRRKTYGCAVEITKAPIPYREKDYEGYELIQEAKGFESSKPDKAVALYLKSIKVLNEAERVYEQFRGNGKTKYDWKRDTAYPINTLSLLLEKNGKYRECLQLIKKYKQIRDKRGLSKSDIESISKREARIIKKLS